MSTNDFLSWAISGGANVDSQATYAARPAVSTGVTTGTALSSLANKTWRQSSVWAHVLGQIIVDELDVNATDDGNVALLESNFLAAIAAYVLGSTRGSPNYAVATGAVNAPAVTVPALSGAAVAGFQVWVKMNQNNTGGVTLTVNANAPIAVLNRDGSALHAHQLQAGSVYPFEFDGSVFQLQVPNVGAGLSFDGNGNIQVTQPVPPGTLLNIRSFGPGSSVYTPTAGTNNVLIRLRGGAGGSGGVLNANVTSGGGGAGAFLEHYAAVGAFSGQTLVVGAAGTGGNSSGGDGTDGGASTFVSLTAPGGKHSPGQTVATPGNDGQFLAGARSAVATGGSIDDVSGQGGTAGLYLFSGTTGIAGIGGSSHGSLGGDGVVGASVAGNGGTAGHAVIFEFA